MEGRIARLEEAVSTVKDTLGRLETLILRLDTKMEAGFKEVRAESRAEIQEVRTRQERDFRLIFGVLLTTLAGVAAWLLTYAVTAVGHKLGLS